MGAAGPGGSGGPNMGGSAGPASYQGGQMAQVQGYGWNKTRLKTTDSEYGARALGGSQPSAPRSVQGFGGGGPVGGSPAGGGPMGGGGLGGSAMGGGGGAVGGGGGALGGALGGGAGSGGDGAGTANQTGDTGSAPGGPSNSAEMARLERCNQAQQAAQGQVSSLSQQLQQMGQRRSSCGQALEGDVGCYHCNNQQWGWWQTWCSCAQNRCNFISTCNQLNQVSRRTAAACNEQPSLQNCSQ